MIVTAVETAAGPRGWHVALRVGNEGPLEARRVAVSLDVRALTPLDAARVTIASLPQGGTSAHELVFRGPAGRHEGVIRISATCGGSIYQDARPVTLACEQASRRSPHPSPSRRHRSGRRSLATRPP